MNSLPIVSGYFGPIVLIVALFVLFKVPRPSLPAFDDPKTEARIALALFALFAAIAVGSSLVFRPMHDMSSLPTAVKVRTLLVWSILLLPFLAVLAVRKQGLDTCFIPKKGFLLHLAASVGMGFLAVVIYLLTIGKLMALPSVAARLFSFSSLFLLAPILVEEFVFRGFLLARLTAGLGRHKGVLLAASMFGLAHYPRYLASSQMGFAQATMAVVLATAIAVGGGYGVFAIRCMFYGVFIHWCMDVVPTVIPTG